MANSEEQHQQPAEDRRIDDVDCADQILGGSISVDVSSSGEETAVGASRSVTRRLTEILVEDSDADLLMQRSERDDGVIQWLRALDLQVMGACRADERLKPLLKMNASIGVADDGLLAHLSQHFEPSEVGMLARCLCAPLVSIRVGKINKQGTFLSPTSVRGNLCLTLLPTSDLRISFNGDDGSEDRVATLTTEAQFSEVEIQEISADKSGRSFYVKNSDGVVSYFWCSEKSTLMGYELLRKLKDFLVQKPSLAELTGISESRLNSFVSHLRASLAGSVVNNAQASGAQSASNGLYDSSHSSVNCSKNSRVRQYSSQYQSCLSPRPSSFKEGMQKSLSDIRIAAREKLRRRGENYVPRASLKTTDASSSRSFQKDELPEVNGTTLQLALSELPVSGQIPSSAPSPFSPHYCWCPISSPLQLAKAIPLLPISSTESFALPPLSSLLSSKLDLSEIPPLNFPTSSQQIPTFTPLACDPIVHIPVIDVYSSGQGYLVSAGPSISTSIPPLKIEPLLPKTESMVEKSARETLRMLISSSSSSSNQGKPQLLEVFPSVFIDNNKMDVEAFPTSISAFELVLLSENSGSRNDLSDCKEKGSSSDPSSSKEAIE